MGRSCADTWSRSLRAGTGRFNRQIFWDDVVMFCHFDEYRLGIREMQAEDIIEIDGIDELAQADPSYRTYLDSLDG